MLPRSESSKIQAILEALRSGPKLSAELPRFANALLTAEELGLCRATRLTRLKGKARVAPRRQCGAGNWQMRAASGSGNTPLNRKPRRVLPLSASGYGRILATDVCLAKIGQASTSPAHDYRRQRPGLGPSSNP